MRNGQTQRINGYELFLAAVSLLPALALTAVGLMHWPVFLFTAAPFFFLFFLFLFCAIFPARDPTVPLEEALSGQWF